jgi:hypothetical protein
MSNAPLKLRMLYVVKFRYNVMMDTSSRGSGASGLASIRHSQKYISVGRK